MASIERKTEGLAKPGLPSVNLAGDGGGPLRREPATIVEALRSTPPYVYVTILIMFTAWTFVSMDVSFPGLALPAISTSLHVSVSDLSYALGGFAFIEFLVPLLMGRLLDRYGRRKMFNWSLIGTGVFSALTAPVVAFWQFIVVRCVAAGSFGATEPTINTHVAEEAPKQVRGLFMGFVQAGYPLGAAIAGYIASALLAGPGWRPLFLVAFAPVLVVIAVTYFTRDPSRFRAARALALEQGGDAARPGWRHLFRGGRARQTIVGSLFGFCINGGIGLVLGVLTAYLVKVDHISLSSAAFLFSLSNWAALAGQLFIGWLADHVPSKWIMTVSPLLAAAAIASLLVSGLSYSLAMICLVCFGFFGNGTFGCYPRYVAESYPTEYRGTGLSFVLGCSFLTLSFMPIIGGFLIDTTHATTIPLISGIVVAFASVAMLFGRNIRPQRDLEEELLAAGGGAKGLS
jgi:AAHS family cis,cis-muconate transporter-like MFS transporter